MDTTLYRIRRKSDGRWYGRKGRYAGKEDCWKKQPGRYLRSAGLRHVFVGFFPHELADLEVVKYELSETGRRDAADVLFEMEAKKRAG